MFCFLFVACRGYFGLAIVIALSLVRGLRDFRGARHLSYFCLVSRLCGDECVQDDYEVRNSCSEEDSGRAFLLFFLYFFRGYVREYEYDREGSHYGCEEVVRLARYGLCVLILVYRFVGK